jgi:pimeloyl-ACP methyl ester carboxylesterase
LDASGAQNRNSPPEPDRVELDGIELAQYLCNYLEKRKIIVLGHSWGSYLAVGMIQRRPELFAAYVGTGQIGSWRANVQVQFDCLLAKARAANDRKQVDQLEAIGKPDPTSAQQYFSWWSMRNPYMSPDDSKWFQELRRIARSDAEFTEEYLKTLGDGMMYSGRTTVNAMLATELPTTANTFKVPFFVIQGMEDMVRPTSGAIKYFSAVKAPKKKLFLIEHAGHFAAEVTQMNAPDRQRWFRMVVLLGAVYFVFGVAFAAFAGWSESNWMHETWNRLGFLASAVAFALHIGYEHFRLRTSSLVTASHVSMAVALGAFALAVSANIHGYRVGSSNRRLLTFALVAWPAITAIPAFVVALVAAAGLSLRRRST